MIDGIGGRLPPPPLRGASAADPAPATAARPARETPTAAPTASGPSRDTTASPPVDTAKVDRIRAAIADGTYPIEPAKIAAAMIARDRARG